MSPWMTAQDTARVVQSCLDDYDEAMAFRLLLQGIDCLRALKTPEDLHAWFIEPPRITDKKFDTLFRAVALHVATELNFEPQWAPPERLSDGWVLARPSQVERAKRESPSYLAALNLFLTPESLTNV